MRDLQYGVYFWLCEKKFVQFTLNCTKPQWFGSAAESVINDRDVAANNFVIKFITYNNYCISNATSQTCTLLNGKPLIAEQPVFLKEMDIVTVGKNHFIFHKDEIQDTHKAFIRHSGINPEIKSFLKKLSSYIEDGVMPEKHQNPTEKTSNPRNDRVHDILEKYSHTKKNTKYSNSSNKQKAAKVQSNISADLGKMKSSKGRTKQRSINLFGTDTFNFDFTAYFASKNHAVHLNEVLVELQQLKIEGCSPEIVKGELIYLSKNGVLNYCEKEGYYMPTSFSKKKGNTKTQNYKACPSKFNKTSMEEVTPIITFGVDIFDFDYISYFRTKSKYITFYEVLEDLMRLNVSGCSEEILKGELLYLTKDNILDFEESWGYKLRHGVTSDKSQQDFVEERKVSTDSNQAKNTNLAYESSWGHDISVFDFVGYFSSKEEFLSFETVFEELKLFKISGCTRETLTNELESLLKGGSLHYAEGWGDSIFKERNNTYLEDDHHTEQTSGDVQKDIDKLLEMFEF